MPNHVHSNEQAPSEKNFFEFHKALNRDFTQTYNEEHCRKDALFMKPFGFAPKTVGKRIRDNIAYIVNNAVVGNLVKDVDKYKWNLMAYRNSNHPFSSKIVLRKASRRLRKSVELLQYYYDRKMPLNYNRQRMLFKSLSSEEIVQLTDLITSLHNCLDYKAIARLYDGNVENVVLLAKKNSGSEHDIPEDFEDYSAYQSMMRIALEYGIDLKTCNFETMSSKDLQKMSEVFSRLRYSPKQIQKFLHLDPWHVTG